MPEVVDKSMTQQAPIAGAAPTQCPVCHGVRSITKYRLWDDRYGYPGTYDLLRCPQCTHEYLGACFRDAQLTELYTKYYPRRNIDPEKVQAHQPRSGLNAWFEGGKAGAFRWVPSGVRILDIGCGFGQTLMYHRNRGCDVSGTELDENARAIAKIHGLDIRIGAFSADGFEASSFDFVTMDQVIEHLQYPEKVLNDVYRVLRPRGKLIIATPRSRCLNRFLFGRKWVHWHTPYHLQFFNAMSMAKLAEQTGFTVVEKASTTNSAWLNFQWHHLLTYPKQGERSAFWSGIQRSRGKQMVARILNVIHAAKINHLVTRIEDALRVGDNQLFVLVRND